ncbi:hypothetical protein Vadar_029293 [Vaccinium darrowii]|uniref:Uncharacterized protein n=1 Tax=Vaccinium darrowii TaxID=229202 RepID=A0ACB7XKN1_9ERIC|nr:hypothetical protein Vadar_029293 [Vaccinium darrowii]
MYETKLCMEIFNQVINARVQVLLGASIWAIFFYLHALGWQEEKQFIAPLKNETRPFVEHTVVLKDREKVPTAAIIALASVGGLALVGMGIYVYLRVYTQQDPQEPAGVEGNVVSRRVAAQRLDQQMIKLFPMLPFSRDKKIGFGEIECRICLVEFVNGENLRVLPSCRHIFHHDCINLWLTSKSTECPICRHDYLGWEHRLIYVP